MRSRLGLLMLGLFAFTNAQGSDEHERVVREFCSRTGRPVTSVRRTLTEPGRIELRLQDGGILTVRRSGRFLLYYNTEEKREANLRSRTEAARMTTDRAEHLARAMLPTEQEWRVIRAKSHGANKGDVAGTVSVTLNRVYHGVATGPDSLDVAFDGYSERVVSMTESRGTDVIPPPANRISEGDARRRAFAALDRLPEPVTRDAIIAAWRADPPQGGLQFFGLRDERTGDPEALRLPPGFRLTWQFGTDQVWVGVDAETGAICHVSEMMGRGAPRQESSAPPAVPQDTTHSNKAASSSPPRSPQETTDFPWLWGLAAIPVAAGAWWWAARAVRTK